MVTQATTTLPPAGRLMLRHISRDFRLQQPAGLDTATTPGILPYASLLKLFKFVPDEFVTRAEALPQTLCVAPTGIPVFRL